MVETDIPSPDISGKLAYQLSDFPADFQERVRVNGVTGCWIWIGAMSGDYGLYQGRGAHIFACEFAHGQMPEGHKACHKCDVRECVNPSHLFPGTHEQNMLDMAQKGRHMHGEKASRCGLTNEKVRAILNDRRPTSEIAAAHGVGSGVISAILRGQTWKHISREGTFAEFKNRNQRVWYSVYRSNLITFYDDGSIEVYKYRGHSGRGSWQKEQAA